MRRHYTPNIFEQWTSKLSFLAQEPRLPLPF
jgi:hypothetical protein